MLKRITITSALMTALLLVGCSSEADQNQSRQSEPRQNTQETAQIAVVGDQAPDFTLTDTDGNARSLSDFTGKYVVLEWVNFDCPFVRAHYLSGNIPSMQTQYTEEGVVWLSICSSAPGKQGHFEGEELANRMEQAGWQGTAYLIDESGEVGRLYEAKTTPHMYLISPDGMLVYAGAINSKPSADPEDIPEATNYVQAAFAAHTSGEPVSPNVTAPYGCSVKY